MVNVCFMSRRRIARLTTAIQFVERNTKGVDYRISLLFDDDPEAYEHFKTSGHNCYLYSPQQECVKMTNKSYIVTKELGLDYFVFLNDDMEVQENWLMYALEDYKSAFPDDRGCVSFNMIPGGDTLCVAGLTSVGFVDNVLGGTFFNEVFVHNEGDSEFTYRVFKAKRFKWSEKSRVFHNHYMNGTAPIDETYTNSSKYYSSDLKKRIELIGDGVYRGN